MWLYISISSAYTYVYGWLEVRLQEETGWDAHELDPDTKCI